MNASTMKTFDKKQIDKAIYKLQAEIREAIQDCMDVEYIDFLKDNLMRIQKLKLNTA